MPKSRLKQLRIAAGLTQVEVARALNMSQPNYQRWESGSAQVPAGKVKKLARALRVPVDEILGRRAAFDLLGIDNSVGDDRTYYGEVAVHFQGKKGILLPISEAARCSLHRQFEKENAFIMVESLDNRVAFVRRDAITDIYFSSEAYDDYGPEEYTDHLGVFPDDSFWRIVEHMDAPEQLADEFDNDEIETVVSELRLNCSSGNGSGRRNGTSEETADEVNRFCDRAKNTSWQFSSGELRQEYVFENRLLFDALSCLGDTDEHPEEMILLPMEGYHRSILIRKTAVDYISAPRHKFNAGALQIANEEIESTR